MPSCWERWKRLSSDSRRRDEMNFADLSLCSRSLAVLPMDAFTLDAAADGDW